MAKKGDLKGYGTVWYHPDGIASILSLHNVQKKHKVTYASSQGTDCVVHKADGTSQVFMPLKIKLIFFDVINTVD